MATSDQSTKSISTPLLIAEQARKLFQEMSDESHIHGNESCETVSQMIILMVEVTVSFPLLRKI